MKIKQAREFGPQVAALVHAGKIDQAMDELTPLLNQRIKFPILGVIGEAIGKGPIKTTNNFLPHVAATKTEGGWPIIGMALNAQLERDLPGAMSRGQAFIIQGDIWYCADILSERVPGPALLLDFQQTRSILEKWREDENFWVRRSVGIATHYWAKRAADQPGAAKQAQQMMALLEPLFSEWEINAVKGVAWGLKTMGRYYPNELTAWLVHSVKPSQRKHRAHMLRKAITFLSPEQKDRVTNADSK